MRAVQVYIHDKSRPKPILTKLDIYEVKTADIAFAFNNAQPAVQPMVAPWYNRLEQLCK